MNEFKSGMAPESAFERLMRVDAQGWAEAYRQYGKLREAA